MQSIEPDWNCQYSYFYIFLYFLYIFYWNLSNIKFRLYCFHKNFIKFITEIFKISISTVVVIIWAEIWCWTWSGCGRVVYCHECKCWLVPRSDLMDHITSQGGQCASAPGVFLTWLWNRDIWRLILNQSMEKSSILVISFNIKLQEREQFRVMFAENICQINNNDNT